MIRKLKSFIYWLLPDRVLWLLLLQILPKIVDFTAKYGQGLAPLWAQNNSFMQKYNKVKKTILLDKKRAFVLYNFVKHCSNLKGDFAEVGVYKGGSTKLISLSNKFKKNIYAFDTFEGFPKLDKQKNAGWEEGQLKASYQEVNDAINDENVKFIKGIFPATAKELSQQLVFSFVHLDTDLYEGTIDGCRFFFDRMVKGGVLLVDDYGLLSCQGVKQAIDEFFFPRNEQPIYLPSGQCFIIKQ
tara:strand:- start:224 stop:949 length:726 start_codon:yes stop_codon:yes gene_type:complete